jgi:hypothetical protein
VPEQGELQEQQELQEQRQQQQQQRSCSGSKTPTEGVSPMPVGAWVQARAGTPPPYGCPDGLGMTREVGPAVADVLSGGTTTGAGIGGVVCDDADAALYWSAIASPAQAIDHAINEVSDLQCILKGLATLVAPVQGHDAERLHFLKVHAQAARDGRRAVVRLARVSKHALGREGWDAWVVAEAFAVAGKMQALVDRAAMAAVETGVETVVLATESEAPRGDTCVLGAPPTPEPEEGWSVVRGRVRRKQRAGR